MSFAALFLAFAQWSAGGFNHLQVRLHSLGPHGGTFLYDMPSPCL
jgi:hypothetical protein